jgi:hypothetical protein
MTELPGLRQKVNEVMFPREAKWRVLLFNVCLNQETMELQQINLTAMTEEAVSSDLQTVWNKSSRKADVCNSNHLLHNAQALSFKCDKEYCT